MSITAEQLQEIMPVSSLARRALLLPSIISTMTEFEIGATVPRAAAFLAQIAHETGQLKWLEELGSGEKYNGRADLGNTQPGDGPRFKGRGMIMITGRSNYSHYGKLLGIDLLSHPEQAANAPLCARIAGAFWSEHGLNPLADSGDFQEITKRINGGLIGEADREAFYRRALNVLRG